MEYDIHTCMWSDASAMEPCIFCSPELFPSCLDSSRRSDLPLSQAPWSERLACSQVSAFCLRMRGMMSPAPLYFAGQLAIMPVLGDSNDPKEGGKGRKKKVSHRHHAPSISSHLDHNAQLLEAITQAKPRLVRRLLCSKADPNYQGGTKMMSPLMLACEITDEDTREAIIELLLDKNAIIDLQDTSGQTAMMKAVLINDITTVRNFLKHGADIMIEDADANSSLSYSAEMGCTECLRTLVKEGKRRKNFNIDHQNLQGLTPLLLAAREGNLEAVKVLVEGGASLSMRDLEHFMNAQEWMKLSGCFSVLELEFLNPSSKKKNYYRQERMKRGIKTLADYLPTLNENGGTDSPNVFTMHQPEASGSSTFHSQFPQLQNEIISSADPPLKSMFSFDSPAASKKQSSPPNVTGQSRKTFPSVSSVKTDLYKSSYLSRRKSILLKNSSSSGYHTGALAPLSDTALDKQDISGMKTTRLPPINK